MDSENFNPSNSPRFSFLKKINLNFKVALVFSLLLIFLIGGLLTFWFLQKPKNSNTQVLINPNNLLEITLSFDENAKKKISIEKITEKVTKTAPPSPLQTPKEYTLQVINDRGQIIMQAPFDLPMMFFGDSQLFDKNSTESGNKITTKGNQVITLPDVKGSSVRVIDKSNNVIDEKKFISKLSFTSYEQRQRIADSGSPYSIVFISLGYSSSQISLYHDHIQLIKNLLLSKTPYKEHAGQLTFNVIDNTTAQAADLGCTFSTSGPTPPPSCDPAKVNSFINDQGKPSNVSVILAYFNGQDRGSATSAVGGPAVVSFTSNASVGNVTMHELGHAIGGLMDEYVYTDPAYVAGYTTAVKNCYKGSPPNPEWAGLVSDSDYKFIGCSNKDWYRTTDQSIMRDHMNTTYPNYNPVSLKYMNQAMGFSSSSDPGSGSSSGGNCKTLQNGVNKVTESTTFCSGTISTNQGDAGVVQIGADNITVDGGGVVIDGGNKSGSGITSDSHSGITIKNFTVKNFSKGIVAANGSHVTISNNDVSGNEKKASGFHNINAGLSETPGGGILVNNISASTISGNVGTNQDAGINLYNSSGTTISGNNMSDNAVWGVRLYGSSGNTISSNHTDNVGATCGECDSAGILLVMGSNSNTVQGNSMKHSGDGFFIGNENGTPSNNNNISHNDGSDSPHNCFEATYSSGNTFSDNIAKNCNYGFWLGYSTSTSLKNNFISGNKNDGIMWTNGKPGSLQANTFSENTGWGINLTNNGDARWANSDAPTNISAFPDGNKFFGNKGGNCKGNGFSETSKQCPTDGTKPTDPGAIDPTKPGGPGGGSSGNPVTPSYNPPDKDGYCSKGNGTDANPHWANTSRPIACNFGDTKYANDVSANGYCAQTYSNNAPYFYECVPPQSGGSNPIAPIVICKDHKGVDGSKFPNGFVDSICITATPTASNYKDGLFSYSKATANPNPYKDGKYYDVYQCSDSGTYDFIHSQGTENICKSYPWVQDASGTTPTPPSGSPCSDPSHPYWDGTKCTYRPDACNNIGPGGHQNVCQPSACGSGLEPDTHSPKPYSEANTACREYYNNDPQKQFCCRASSSPAPPSGTTPAPGSSGSGTETEYGHCYHGDSDCAPQYKCNRNPGDATSYCIYRNPSDPTAYCSTANNTHYCANSLTGCDQAGLLQGDNYSCSRAGMGSYCCNKTSGSTSPVTPATSGCPHYTDSSGNPASDSKSVCQATTSCPNGSRRGTAANDAACQAYYPGDSSKTYCCVDNRVTNIASISVGQQVTTCKRNSDCVLLRFGNACVFTNNPSVGVCK